MDFSWKEILTALGIVGGVPFFKWLGEQIEKKKQEKQARAAQNISNTVEFRKVEIGDRAQTNDELWQIIESKNTELQRLDGKIKELEQTYSLPRPLMTKIYHAMRVVARQVDNIRSLVERGEKKENVIVEIDILDQKIDDVDKLLP